MSVQAPMGTTTDAAAAPAAPPPRDARRCARAFLLRAGAIYTVFYVLPFPLGFPGTAWVAAPIAAAKEKLAWWVASALELPLPTVVRNSSDSLTSYVQIALLAAIASIVAGVLVGLGRRAGADMTWRAWWSVLLRYFVAASMASYGAVKVLKSQFPALQPSDLQTTYGESSPMGLLWRMMSLSTGYSVFTGLVEVVGALLLLFRRTTLLGALLLAGALGNVVALNFCFDVPVKIGSVHLLAFTLCLIAPDVWRLIDFFSGKTVAARAAPPAYAGARLAVQRGLQIVKALAVVGLVGTVSFEAWNAYRTWGDGAPPQPLWAIYRVTEMTIEDTPLDAPRWTHVTIDRQGFVAFIGNGVRRRFDYEYDPSSASVVVTNGGDRLVSSPGSTTEHPDAITLEGTFNAHHTTLRLLRVRADEITLTSRGFHWVSDQSFHR